MSSQGAPTGETTFYKAPIANIHFFVFNLFFQILCPSTALEAFTKQTHRAWRQGASTLEQLPLRIGPSDQRGQTEEESDPGQIKINVNHPIGWTKIK